MKRYSSTEKHYRVFFRAMPRNSIADQRARAAIVVGLNGDAQEYGADRLDEWVQFARDGDVLVVDCLEILPPPRSKRDGIPTNKLGEIKGAIAAKGLTLIEARTGTAPDTKRWREAAQNVARGRRLTTETAREMGRKGGKRRPVETIQSYWEDHPDKADFRAIWRGAEGTYADAFEAVNAAAKKAKYIRLSSVTMAFRVFGHRAVRKRK